MRIPVQVLVEMYQNSLYVVAFSICKNTADAQDVVQDTFLQYHSKQIQFNNEQHIRAWLFKVAINKAKNINRSFWRRNRQSLEDYMKIASFETPDLSDVFQAVMNLPEKYRIVIHLYYYEDYAINEIADVLDLSVSNVKVRLSRGRKLLKETLKEGWDDDE
ncbi:MAG: sigma-70 family RNA polymerase sigma factor [Holdemanella sp.]|mgnify:CR=1 FL=1|nr:sigma-70 family RNA polymerase sigma factor [Holdemanella sp.]